MPKQTIKKRNIKKRPVIREITNCGSRRGKGGCWFEDKIIDIVKPIAA